MTTFKFTLCAGLVLVLPLAAIGALAQGPGGGPGGAAPQVPGAPGPGGPPGQGRGAPPPPPPTQGFESNTQVPATYNAQEAAAAAIVEHWVTNSNNHNLDQAMAVMDDKMLVRADPASLPRIGPVAQCTSYPFTRNENFLVRLDELYVVGGPLDTLALFKRADINGNATVGRGGFGGFNVLVAVFVRVSNGRITEWIDAPIVRVGGLVNAAGGPASQMPGGGRGPAGGGAPPPGAGPGAAPGGGGGAAAPPAAGAAPGGGFGGGGARGNGDCNAYPKAGLVPTLQPKRPGEILQYGTSKPERYWVVEEAQAAQTVRAWFAAWQSGDPLLLGAFVDQNVAFRPNAAADIAKGRTALLRAVCGTMGGQRRLTKLFPLGADFNTIVLTESVKSDGTRIASMFSVQKGLIQEWLDVVVEAKGPTPAPNPNSAGCQAVNTAFPN